MNRFRWSLDFAVVMLIAVIVMPITVIGLYIIYPAVRFYDDVRRHRQKRGARI